jgi:hypothetical protein
MTDETKVGRLEAKEVGETQVLDDPSKAMASVLTQLDAILDKVGEFATKLDNAGVDGGGFVAISDELKKLKFRL